MFEDIHRLDVLDEIRKGRTVFCLDKYEQEVYIMNDITATEALEKVYDETDSYYFYAKKGE